MKRIEWVPFIIGALIPLIWIGYLWDVPLTEDALFWFYPGAKIAVSHGLTIEVAGDLPEELLRCSAHQIPPQWATGIPDYAHPPLWYWWLGTILRILPGLPGIRLACAVPGILCGLGYVMFARRLGNSWAGLSVWVIPSVVSQLTRPELDLPLLALTPWCLWASLSGRAAIWSVICVVGVWIKEPAVLFCVTAMIPRDTRIIERISMAALPLMALGAWAMIHGDLAPLEKTPNSLKEALTSIIMVLQYVLLDQGRFVGLFGIYMFRRHWRLWLFVFTWILFFSVVRFYGASAQETAYSHVRYLTPAIATSVVLLGIRFWWTPLLTLFWLNKPSSLGPEASLSGANAALALRDASNWLAEQPVGERVWVGAYHAAGLCLTGTGYVPDDQPTLEFQTYSFGTRSSEFLIGDLVIASDFGEPTGVLEHDHRLSVIKEWKVHGQRAWLWRIEQ